MLNMNRSVAELIIVHNNSERPLNSCWIAVFCQYVGWRTMRTTNSSCYARPLPSVSMATYRPQFNACKKIPSCPEKSGCDGNRPWVRGWSIMLANGTVYHDGWRQTTPPPTHTHAQAQSTSAREDCPCTRQLYSTGSIDDSLYTCITSSRTARHDSMTSIPFSDIHLFHKHLIM